MRMAGLGTRTHLALVYPSVMWADVGSICLWEKGKALAWGGLSLGSGEPLGIWMVVLGSEQGTRETPGSWGTPQPRQEGHSWIAASKLKWRMALGGLVWAPLLCLAMTSQEGQDQPGGTDPSP